MRATAFAFAVMLVAAVPAGAVVFDDGGVHVIDVLNSFPNESVTVDDGPMGATTLVILDGGEVGLGVLALGSSSITMVDE